MSRARKSSETICPERFCGPPQHSKEPADKGVVGLGGVFREIQVAREEQQDVQRKKRLQRGGVEETEGHLGGGGGRYKNRNKAHIVSNSAKKNKPQRMYRERARGGGGCGCCSARETDPKRLKAARAIETSGGQEEAQHLTALHADGPEPGNYQQPLSRCTEGSLSNSSLGMIYNKSVFSSYIHK